jgi:hypothetical protein
MNEAITLTLITCKRFNYFQKTLNSFAENCLNLDLISNIICIDDNSDIEDIKKMEELIKKLFPSIPILMAHKYLNNGQSYSMNFLWKVIDTRFIFHLEDDWEFKKSGHFISEGISILNKYPDIKQLCLVEGAEHSEEISIDNSEKYTVLDWKKDNHWWPNFSFRPGVYDVKTIKEEIGFFESGKSVEEIYAHKYAKKYKSAYMKKGYEYCHHIGDQSAFPLNNSHHGA